jgi:hypothetical protein
MLQLFCFMYENFWYFQLFAKIANKTNNSKTSFVILQFELLKMNKVFILLALCISFVFAVNNGVLEVKKNVVEEEENHYTFTVGYRSLGDKVSKVQIIDSLPKEFELLSGDLATEVPDVRIIVRTFNSFKIMIELDSFFPVR